MKRLAIAISLVLFVFVFVACTTIPVPELKGLKTEGLEEYKNRGNSYLLSKGEEITVSMQGTPITKKKGSVVVGIENNTDEIINFEAANIEIFAGNIDEGKWKNLGEWDPETYWANAQQKYKRARTWSWISDLMRVGADVMGIVGATTDVQVGSTMLAAGATGATDIAIITSEIARNIENPDWLRENLLFDSMVRKNEPYLGLVMFDLKKNVDFKLVYNDKERNDQREFIFQRTDREEILNPWLDKKFKARNTFGVSFNPFEMSYGFTYLYSAPKGIGSYYGFGVLYNPKIAPVSDRDIIKDYGYDYNFEKNGKAMVNLGINLNGGLTIKLLPYTWILLGVNFQAALISSEQGTINDELLWKQVDNNLNYSSINPQVGFNFITNMIDVFTIAEYNLKTKKFSANLGLGWAF